MKTIIIATLLACLCTAVVKAQKNPHFINDRTTIVHLFEWKWTDIAQECENFLGPKGFGGVQISPPNENLVIGNRPWWERYQPVSYLLNTRSGDSNELADMITRCNNVGVRIYVDTVINHMSAMDGFGTGGSSASASNEEYPVVPFDKRDFHEPCAINNYQDAENVRNCELEGLRDLDHANDYVKDRIVAYMNDLVRMGVAGFRIDAAKHMWPVDLGALISKVDNLNTNYNFAENSRPFIFQEVIDYGGEAVTKYEYTQIGAVLEFYNGMYLGNTFQGGIKLACLSSWGPNWECGNGNSMLEGSDAVIFIDNHDTQRTGGDSILTYKKSKPYKMAIAFMLAHPYSVTRIMSSYAFDDKDQPPPQDSNGNIISAGFNADGTCTNGWVCEHRWSEIFNMVEFRNLAGSEEVNAWWTNGDQQIAFARGEKAFIALNNYGDLNEKLFTNLPAGVYCDVISGSLVDGNCTGKIVEVGDDGYANIVLMGDELDGALAIHVHAQA